MIPQNHVTFCGEVCYYFSKRLDLQYSLDNKWVKSIYRTECHKIGVFWLVPLLNHPEHPSGHLEYPRNQIITTQNTLEIAQQHLIVTYRQGKEEEVRDDNPITALLLNKTNTDSKIQRD